MSPNLAVVAAKNGTFRKVKKETIPLIQLTINWRIWVIEYYIPKNIIYLLSNRLETSRRGMYSVSMQQW